MVGRRESWSMTFQLEEHMYDDQLVSELSRETISGAPIYCDPSAPRNFKQLATNARPQYPIQGVQA